MDGNAKAIILAAGEGTRLKKYTQDLPKGMLKFAGRPLIERQIETLRRAGISDISIVRGFAADKIDYSGVSYFYNEAFTTTNMVASLFCAREKLHGRVIVCYSDILCEGGMVRRMLDSLHGVSVAADMDWVRYWTKRYGRVDFDTEGLRIDGERIVELGDGNAKLEDISARYIGMIGFSPEGIEVVKHIWDEAVEHHWDTPWQVSGKTAAKAYMTDLLQAVIDSGYPVHALKCHGGWIEFDTNEDYERASEWQRNGSLAELLNIDECGGVAR